MPLYDYECAEHGYFKQKNSIANYKKGDCPDCGKRGKKVILSAPGLDIEGMADAGCPSAFETSGDRLTRRHKEAGQYNNTLAEY